MNSTLSSFLKICSDLGTSPLPELVSCLSMGAKSCTISSLNMEDNQVIALCAVVPLSPIEDLVFTKLSLNINSWVAIADSCSKSKPLQRLTLTDCSFGSEASQGLAIFARTLGGAQLKELTIISCSLGDEFIRHLALDSNSKILASDRLESLRLDRCNISCEGACHLATALEAVGMMSSLKSLSLPRNRIGDKGACSLAAMLMGEGSSVPLQSLELEENPISDVGGLALCRAAKSALVMSRLHLGQTLITDNTILALADALRHSTLKDVSVTGCNKGVRESSVVELIKAVAKNNSVHSLDLLNAAPLGPEGTAALCQMLRYSASLSKLRVDVTSRDCAEIVSRELPNNRSLMHLTLGGPVPDHLKASMSQVLAANTMRAVNASPVRSSPHIHAWIEGATLASGKRTSTTAVLPGSPTVHQMPPPPTQTLSPDTKAGGAVKKSRVRTGTSSVIAGGSEAGFSHNTYNTGFSLGAKSHVSFQFSQSSRRASLSIVGGSVRISQTLAAGGSSEKAAIIFRKHDVDQDNLLNKSELLAALDEIGVLEGIKAKHVGRFVDAQYKKVDYDKDGKISLQDFCSWYDQFAKYQEQASREGRIKASSAKSLVPPGVETQPAMKRVFKNYCKFALGQGRQYAHDAGLHAAVPSMNMQQFARLCQDAGFVEPEGRLPVTAIEVVFFRCRPPGGRRLAYKEFIEALGMVSYEAGVPFDEVLVVLGIKSGPPEEGVRGGSDYGGVASSEFSATIAASLDGARSFNLQSIQEAMPGQEERAQHSGSQVIINSSQSIAKKAGPGSFPLPAPLAAKKKKANKSTAGILYADVAEPVVAVSAKGAPSNAPGSVSNPLFESMEQMLLKGVKSASSADNAALLSRLTAIEQHLQASDLMQQHHESSKERQEVASRLSRLEEENKRLTAAAFQSTSSSSSSPGGGHEYLKASIDSLTAQLLKALNEFRQLSTRVDMIQDEQVKIKETVGVLQSSVAGVVNGRGGAPGVEKKLMDRQARFEGALMQVARQVDLLETRLREEHEASIKSLLAGRN